jgi:hypothetical protein
VSGEGDFLRAPREVLEEWTFEQVWDALEIKRIRAERRRVAEAAAKARAR